MKLSTERILTTHVGSLPRPPDLVELLGREDRGEPVDEALLWGRAAAAVGGTVSDQVEAGIDIVSDGEMSKMSYHVYAKHRLAGLGNQEGRGVPGRAMPRDIQDFPEMAAERSLGGGGPELLRSAVCVGPVAHADHAPLDREIANLEAAVAAARPVEAFMNSVSPGCLATYVPNAY